MQKAESFKSLTSDVNKLLFQIKTIFFLFCLVPSQPSNATAVSVASDTILVTWGPSIVPMGVILGYTLYYRDSQNLYQINVNHSTFLFYIRDALQPFTTYSIAIAAYTQFTHGDQTPYINVTTPEGGKHSKTL